MKYLALFTLLVLAPSLALAAPKGGFAPSWGLSFQIENVNLPLDNNTDGVIAGAGLKFWPLEMLALRAVVFLDYSYTAATAQTQFRSGLSLGAEWHFIRGAVSPYAGLLGGIEFWVNPDVADFHAGAVVGLEMKPLPFLAFFVEYSLLAKFRSTGTEIDLGYNHLPTFGAILYLN